jgi:hypothetical protein
MKFPGANSFKLTMALLVVGCAGDAPEDAADSAPAPVMAVVDGSCGDVYGAEVCTWAETTDGSVTSFGATVPMGSIEGAPDEMEMAWPPLVAALVPLPDPVREQMGVHSLKVYWEAHGHPPGPYLVPHFDFHFYTIDAATTDAIDCSDESKPEALPAGYALPDVDIPELGNLIGLCVPEMGMHALLEEELQSEETFSGTMVIGYYEGDPIFFEPMITRSLLMEGQTFSLDMPSVPGTVEGVRLPTRFEAQFDAEENAYRFVFSD